MSSQLDALEKELVNIRSGGISPITQLLWKHDGDFITGWARTISQGNSRVLEVGCGKGGYLVSLASAGNESYGIDPLSKVSLSFAKEMAKEQDVDIHLLCAAGENIPFQDESFDVVLLISTLQHVVNQKEVLLEIRRVLKPGGRLLVSVPQLRGVYSARRLAAKVKGAIQARKDFFTMDFDSKRLRDILTESGFTILKMRGRKFLPILLPGLLSVLLKR